MKHFSHLRKYLF